MYILLEYKELLSKLQESGFYFHSNVVSYYGWLQCWMTHCKIILYDAVFDWLHCHFRSTYLNLVVLFYKRNRSKAELVNTKQPSDPLLPLAFCSTNPPPLPPAFNPYPPLSPMLSFMGRAGDHYVSWAQCLQSINQSWKFAVFPVCYNSFNASR